MYDNKATYSYLEDLTSCTFRLRTTRRPVGPKAEYRSTPRMVRGSFLFLPPSRLPILPGGFRLQWTRYRAEPRLLEPSSLRPQRWGGDGLVEGCRVVEGSCSTTLYAPIEGFQSAVAEYNLFST